MNDARVVSGTSKRARGMASAALDTRFRGYDGEMHGYQLLERYLRDWGPAIATGVVVAQLAAPHIRGSVMTGIFALLCLIFAARFAFPNRLGAIMEQPPTDRFRSIAGTVIGLCSGLAGVGDGILTNIAMTVAGMPMHKSIGRAAAAGVVVVSSCFTRAR